MTVRRAFVSAAASAILALAGCAGAATNGASATADAPAGQTTFPPAGIALAIGNSATSNTKIADVFDTTAHTLLGRFSAAAPGPHTLLGPIVTADDRQHVFVTAYDTVDPSGVHAGVYEVDLATATTRYFKSLGSGTPVDATMAGSLLQVIVNDTPPNARQTTRVVSIDTATGSVESATNPIPAGADGRQPVPISIVYDRGRKFTYLTDTAGTIYAFFPPSMRYYRKLPGVLPLFGAIGGSAVLDEHHAIFYQLGIFSSVDEHQHHVESGALLATAIATGATRLSTFPYLPVAGALLDRTSSKIYFGSTLDQKLFVSRVDVRTTHYVSRPISFGIPEFLNSGKLAFSNDGSHLLMPVSTGADATLAGAMLEIDPANLTLQNSASSPDSFESGGIVSM